VGRRVSPKHIVRQAVLLPLVIGRRDEEADRPPVLVVEEEK
jgi:hypothetical protein